MTKFKQIIYYLIAYRCNLHGKLEPYHRVFTEIDKENNGFITRTELINKLKHRVHEEDINKIVDAMDIDKDQAIYWNEFVTALITVEIIYNHENLKEVYYYFDQEKKGYFDAKDLEVALTKIEKQSMIQNRAEKMLEETFRK